MRLQGRQFERLVQKAKSLRLVDQLNHQVRIRSSGHCNRENLRVFGLKHFEKSTVVLVATPNIGHQYRH